MEYERPKIEIAKADLVLLSASRPGAGDIGSPSVSNKYKSIWDEGTNDNEIIDYEI